MWSKRQCNNRHERGRKREEIKIAAYERTWKMKIWQINLCKKNNGIFGKKIWEGTRLLLCSRPMGTIFTPFKVS